MKINVMFLIRPLRGIEFDEVLVDSITLVRWVMDKIIYEHKLTHKDIKLYDHYMSDHLPDINSVPNAYITFTDKSNPTGEEVVVHVKRFQVVTS